MALDWNIYLKLYKYNIKKYLRKHEKHCTFTDCKWAIHSIIIVISIQLFSTDSDDIFHFSQAKKNYNSQGEYKRWIHWKVSLKSNFHTFYWQEYHERFMQCLEHFPSIFLISKSFLVYFVENAEFLDDESLMTKISHKYLLYSSLKYTVRGFYHHKFHFVLRNYVLLIKRSKTILFFCFHFCFFMWM